MNYRPPKKVPPQETVFWEITGAGSRVYRMGPVQDKASIHRKVDKGLTRYPFVSPLKGRLWTTDSLNFLLLILYPLDTLSVLRVWKVFLHHGCSQLSSSNSFSATRIVCTVNSYIKNNYDIKFNRVFVCGFHVF